MNELMIDMFLMNNRRYLPESKMLVIKEKLKKIDENTFNQLFTIKFKDPTIVFLFSIFFGAFGIDRFIIKSTLIGILKLITFFLVIPYFVDLFFIQNKTKEYNYERLLEILD